MTLKKDFIQRFVFDDLDARGCFVRLDQTCVDIQQTHHYPPSLAKLLNQFALAAVLLRDSIKIDGSVTIQLRNPQSTTTASGIKLLMADCMSDGRVRAIAEYESDGFAAGATMSLAEMGEGAVLAITITPNQGERYQSIVPMQFATLNQCLEEYFARSEQLPTWFSLTVGQEQAVGIALHALPAGKVTDPVASKDNFERLRLLLNTLTEQEALELDAQQILTRLFHDESCRLFDQNPVEFGCVCSAKKSLEAVKSLGQEDINALIKEQQAQGNANLVVDCHFCFQRYEFPFNELQSLLN